MLYSGPAPSGSIPSSYPLTGPIIKLLFACIQTAESMEGKSLAFESKLPTLKARIYLRFPRIREMMSKFQRALNGH